MSPLYSHLARRTAAVLAAALVSSSLVGPGANAATAPGVGTPPRGTGIGTTTAMSDPRCNTTAGTPPYGLWNFVVNGFGPVCVTPWKDGADNGGATARGVTAKTITVVALTQNAAQTATQKQQGGTPPKNEATGGAGTMPYALRDYLAAYTHVFETWGRRVDLKFVESSGNDEAAQRADAVAVKAMKPFVVLDATPTGEDAFETAIAADKTVVYGYATTTARALKQSPYRWGQADQVAAEVNTAEFAGKQLAKRPARYAGDPGIRTQTRKFGVVYPDGVLELSTFTKEFGKHGGRVSVAMTYTSNGSTVGDPTTAQEQAPLIISKLKASGVTTVVMFTDASMTGALTKQATQQEFRPEWVIGAYQYQDLALLARNYDQDQWAHAFGISNLYPYLVPPADAPTTDAAVWYWGKNTATTSIPGAAYIAWLMSGIHSAGPHLTARTFQQGLFAVPATGGAASDRPLGFQTGFGRTVGLPYDEYMALGTDFAPVWWDSTTKGYSQIFPNQATGIEWYAGGATRYRAGAWPTKPIAFFDRSGAVEHWDTSPNGPVVQTPCAGCPSAGGPGTPAAASG